MWARLRRFWRKLTGQGGRTMVIDPNATSQALIQNYMLDTSIRMDPVESPDEAKQIIKGDAEPPNAFVIHLRQKDGTLVTGMETAMMLAADRRTSRIPMIMVHDPMDTATLDTLQSKLPKAEFVQRPFNGLQMLQLIRKSVKFNQQFPGARGATMQQAPTPPPARARRNDQPE